MTRRAIPELLFRRLARFTSLAPIILLFSGLRAQPVERINCLVPYEIEFSESNLKDKERKEIRFTDHDDHAFWYKLKMEENQKFSYAFEALDYGVNYDFYFYQYDGVNFCRSMIRNNIELISFESSLQIKVKKGETYYLGVQPLSTGSCGHTITFQMGSEILELDARDPDRKCAEEPRTMEVVDVQSVELLTINGHVTDVNTGNPLSAKLIFTDPFLNHQVEVWAGEAGFTANLRKKGDYQVLIKAFGYKDKLMAMSVYGEESPVFRLSPSGEVNFVLENVYFYPNTYALKEESEEELAGVFNFLRNHPEYVIGITGHTNGNKDVRAGRMVRHNGPEWNFNGSARELSLRRAERIKNFLVEKGIKPEQIQTDGKGGDDMIVADPVSMTDAMKNIRVEIRVIGSD